MTSSNGTIVPAHVGYTVDDASNPVIAWRIALEHDINFDSSIAVYPITPFGERKGKIYFEGVAV